MSPLKKKIVDEYEKMIHALSVGKSYDYDYIINMITFLEVGTETANPTLIQNYYLSK